MTVAELISELQKRDPDARVLIDREYHGYWYLDFPDDVQDVWAVRNGVEYNEAAAGMEGAFKGVRIA